MKKRSAGFQKRLDELKGIGLADLGNETLGKGLQFLEAEAEKRTGIQLDEGAKLSFEESRKILENIQVTDLSAEKVSNIVEFVESFPSSPQREKPKSLCNDVLNKIQSTLNWMGRKL